MEQARAVCQSNAEVIAILMEIADVARRLADKLADLDKEDDCEGGKAYEQDGICDTWEVLANMLYPGGLAALKKKSKNSYSVTGSAKCEWADKIGKELNLECNLSPSFNRFLRSLQLRIDAA